MASNVPPTLPPALPPTPPSTPFHSTIHPVLEPIIGTMTQHRLVIEQSDTVDSTYSSETGLSGASAGALDRVATEGPPPYSSPNRSSEESEVVSKSSRDSPSPPPPPSSVPPQTSISPPTSAALLRHLEIWKADGLYTLPFFGCEERTYRFYPFREHAHIKALNLYKKLRTCAPPERWSDLCSNTLMCSRPTAPDGPQVNIGPVLAGDLNELLGTMECSYVLILKARCMKSFGDRDGSAHLDGDSIYQWVSYVSLEHAQAGVVDSLCSGYSIVGNWVELDVSKVSRVKRVRLAGKNIVVEKHRIFAAVGAAGFTGRREWMHLLCGIC
ncbi:hypothetical protein P154DRAFT_528527 [Amniculicola lignicola CBS 123094]|uniref:Uncharacterized protein n=1 Tax=Amniculicola lignicola CBS 123094 TaxID=1392246 RepID=A0A6A5X4L2_9PLEO|nr:hypothetical protein P154DRAFT_528527 [Amniculicola lignicola CBS 123094]